MMEWTLSRALAASLAETSRPAMPAISEEAFRLFYRQTAPPLHRYVARVLGNATETDIPLRIDMTRTFEKLRPQERALMWLAYVEGFDHREIAAALGLRERSVRVLLHRVRHKLAALLGDR